MTHGEDAKHRAQEAAGEVWGERYKAGIGASDIPPLYRCMGGRFCNHQPGTCTATWPVQQNASNPANEPAPPSERDAIVAFMREAIDQGYRSHPMTCEHDKYRWEMCVDCYDAHLHAKLDAIERGDHLKETQP